MNRESEAATDVSADIIVSFLFSCLVNRCLHLYDFSFYKPQNMTACDVVCNPEKSPPTRNRNLILNQLRNLKCI